MGIAASSALRDENAANGPAYGSLESLGGPKKLKKKPVLVLDPEELEAAHAMFHEASADLLGENVERTRRPAMILGLAPMEDDDPDEMGESDEADSADDGNQPDAEAVLSLTRRKSAPILDESGESLGEVQTEADRFGDGGFADPEGLEQDDIDLEQRIFPTLPIQPDLAQDETEKAASSQEAEALGDLTPVIEPAPEEESNPSANYASLSSGPEPKRESKAQLEIEQQPRDDFAAPAEAGSPLEDTVPMPEDHIEAPLGRLGSLQDRIAQRRREQQATAEQEAKSASNEHDFTPLPESYETLRERHKKDWFKLDRDEVEAREVPAWVDENWSDDEILDPPAEETPAAEESFEGKPTATDPAETVAHDPAPLPPAHFDSAGPPELPATRDAATAVDTQFERQTPSPIPPVVEEQQVRPHHHADEASNYEGRREGDDLTAENEFVAEQELDNEQKLAAPVDNAEPTPQENVTLTEDDHVDGYAFMRDQRSRRSAIAATRQGQQSALRAKLLREAELEAEKAEERNSLAVRFWKWLRGLFG